MAHRSSWDGIKAQKPLTEYGPTRDSSRARSPRPPARRRHDPWQASLQLSASLDDPIAVHLRAR